MEPLPSKCTTEKAGEAKPAEVRDIALHLENDAALVDSSRSCVFKGGVDNDIPWYSVVCYGVGDESDHVSPFKVHCHLPSKPVHHVCLWQKHFHAAVFHVRAPKFAGKQH